MTTPSSFDRLFKIAIQPWVIISGLIFIVIAFFYIDQPSAIYLSSLHLKTQVPPLYWLTLVGKEKIYLVLLPLLALFFRYKSHNKTWEARAWFLWLCVLIPTFVCLILKIAFSRARPILLFQDHLYGFYGFQMHPTYWSFPSGHTTSIMGLAFGLCVIFPRYNYAWLIFGLIVSISRVLLTYHFISDVFVAGYL